MWCCVLLQQQPSESEFEDQPSEEKPTPIVESIKEEPVAGWPSFGQLIIDLSKLALEALANIFLYFIPSRFRPGSSKKGLTPLKDSLRMPEDEAEPPVVQKQRTPAPIPETWQAHTPNPSDKYSHTPNPSDKYSEMKPPKIRSASFKDPSLSTKHRSSKRQEFADFYGSGEVPPPYSQSRSKSQKERTRHRQRDKSGEVTFGAVGAEPKPVENKAVDYDDPKFDRYNFRSKYASSDSFRY